MKRRYSRWTSEEIETLQARYPNAPIKELKELFANHTEKSIRLKAHALRIRRGALPWNKGLHGDPRSAGTFQKGHPYYGQKAWAKKEIETLKRRYIDSSPDELVKLLVPRTYSAICAKAHSLGLHKNTAVANSNRGNGIRNHYQEHPEDKAKFRASGIRLAQSPYHHRRKLGEYTLPEESRQKVSKTLIKTYKEHPQIKEAACRALEKGRAIMGLGKGPTAPERKIQSLLNSLDIKAIPQYRFNGFFLDFALPEQKLVILVDGCFWHCCPIHFPMATSKSQQHNLRVDKKREKILKKAGWYAIHIWEHEVDEPATLFRLKKEVMTSHENPSH